VIFVGCGHGALKGRGKDPLTAKEHFTLGTIYEKRGELGLAVREYETALDKDPDFLPATTRLGEFSYLTGQYHQAERYYRRAIELAPRNGDLYNNLCWVYLSQGKKLKEAEDLISWRCPSLTSITRRVISSAMCIGISASHTNGSANRPRPKRPSKRRRRSLDVDV
jgi:hypothetical protein